MKTGHRGVPGHSALGASSSTITSSTGLLPPIAAMPAQGLSTVASLLDRRLHSVRCPLDTRLMLSSARRATLDTRPLAKTLDAIPARRERLSD
jgi:hypothetical protein